MELVKVVLKTIFVDYRNLSYPLLVGAIAAILSSIPNFPFTPEQIADFAIKVIGLVVGFNAIYDIANVSKGNVWQSGKWQKPD